MNGNIYRKLLLLLGSQIFFSSLLEPDPSSNYLKAAQVYDNGSIKAKYYAEAIREDEGIRPHAAWINSGHYGPGGGGHYT